MKQPAGAIYKLFSAQLISSEIQVDVKKDSSGRTKIYTLAYHSSIVLLLVTQKINESNIFTFLTDFLHNSKNGKVWQSCNNSQIPGLTSS